MRRLTLKQNRRELQGPTGVLARADAEAAPARRRGPARQPSTPTPRGDRARPRDPGRRRRRASRAIRNPRALRLSPPTRPVSRLPVRNPAGPASGPRRTCRRNRSGTRTRPKGLAPRPGDGHARRGRRIRARTHGRAREIARRSLGSSGVPRTRRTPHSGRELTRRARLGRGADAGGGGGLRRRARVTRHRNGRTAWRVPGRPRFLGLFAFAPRTTPSIAAVAPAASR
jgi:hypothetical protein